MAQTAHILKFKRKEKASSSRRPSTGRRTRSSSFVTGRTSHSLGGSFANNEPLNGGFEQSEWEDVRAERTDRAGRTERTGRADRAERADRSGREHVSVQRRGTQSDSRTASKASSKANARQASKSTSKSQAKSDAKAKAKAKAKADKMFTKQFGTSSDATAAASGDEAPRAALYKGQMGASQKRASRMQNSESKTSGHSFSPLAFVQGCIANAAQGVSLTTASIKAITALVSLLLVCCFLYTPLQQYYHSQREFAKLSAEYESIESRNDALNVQTDILVSKAGVEDAVRQRFGYVKSGESMGVVVGLSEAATDGLRGSEKIEANVLSSTVKAPEEWYTPLLDAFFGVN